MDTVNNCISYQGVFVRLTAAHICEFDSGRYRAEPAQVICCALNIAQRLVRDELAVCVEPGDDIDVVQLFAPSKLFDLTASLFRRSGGYPFRVASNRLLAQSVERAVEVKRTQPEHIGVRIEPTPIAVKPTPFADAKLLDLRE